MRKPTVLAMGGGGFTMEPDNPALDDLVIASFVSGPGSTTLPMRLYSQVRLGVNPEINAASTLLVGLVSAAVLLASWLTARRGKA